MNTISREKQAVLAQMIRAGASLRLMAATVGVSKNTVQRYKSGVREGVPWEVDHGWPEGVEAGVRTQNERDAAFRQAFVRRYAERAELVGLIASQFDEEEILPRDWRSLSLDAPMRRDGGGSFYDVLTADSRHLREWADPTADAALQGVE